MDKIALILAAAAGMAIHQPTPRWDHPSGFTSRLRMPGKRRTAAGSKLARKAAKGRISIANIR